MNARLQEMMFVRIIWLKQPRHGLAVIAGEHASRLGIDDYHALHTLTSNRQGSELVDRLRGQRATLGRLDRSGPLAGLCHQCLLSFLLHNCFGRCLLERGSVRSVSVVQVVQTAHIISAGSVAANSSFPIGSPEMSRSVICVTVLLCTA